MSRLLNNQLNYFFCQRTGAFKVCFRFFSQYDFSLQVGTDKIQNQVKLKRNSAQTTTRISDCLTPCSVLNLTCFGGKSIPARTNCTLFTPTSPVSVERPYQRVLTPLWLVFRPLLFLRYLSGTNACHVLPDNKGEQPI